MLGFRLGFLGAIVLAACSSFEAAEGVDGGRTEGGRDPADASERVDASGEVADAFAPDFACLPDAGLCEGFERSGAPHTSLGQVVGTWPNEFGPGATSAFSARFTGNDAGMAVQKLLGMGFPDTSRASCTLAFVVDAVGSREVDLLRFTSQSGANPKVVLVPGGSVELRVDGRGDGRSLGRHALGAWSRLSFEVDATEFLTLTGRLSTRAEPLKTDAATLAFGSVAFGLRGVAGAGDWVVRVDDVACFW